MEVQVRKQTYKSPAYFEMYENVETRIEHGFFEYVVPPMEGFWWQDGIAGVDYSDKSSFYWIAPPQSYLRDMWKIALVGPMIARIKQ